MATSAALVVNKGPQAGNTFTVDEPPVTIGRDPRNTLCLDHPQVSRWHARMMRHDDEWIIQDLGSTNGTFVNGETLLHPRPLVGGDIIALGDAVTLTYQERRPSDVDTVPPPPADHVEPPGSQPPERVTNVGGVRTGERPGAASPLPHRVSPSKAQAGQQPKSDLTWIWIAAAFLALLFIAACATVLILAYLGLLPMPF